MKYITLLIQLFFILNVNAASKDVPEVELRSQVENNPFELAPRLDLIEFYRREGRFDEANKDIAMAEKISPGNLSIVEQRAHLSFAQKDFKEAIKHYTRMISADVSKELALSRRSQAHIELKNFPMAVQDLTQLRASVPGNTKIGLLLADTLLMANNPKAARIVLAEEVARQPHVSEVVVRIATLDRAAGNGKMAEENVTKFLVQYPGDHLATEFLAKHWRKNGNLAKSGTLLKEYRGRFPDKAWAVIEEYRLLQELGMNDRSLEILRAFNKKYPGNSEVNELTAAPKQEAPQRTTAADSNAKIDETEVSAPATPVEPGKTEESAPAKPLKPGKKTKIPTRTNTNVKGN
jgi:predicted Zn-dependent protease